MSLAMSSPAGPQPTIFSTVLSITAHEKISQPEGNVNAFSEVVSLPARDATSRRSYNEKGR